MILLRVQMPDQPGSLGKVATAIGSAGADIVSVRIVGRNHNGQVVDDFVCDLPPGILLDSVVSAFAPHLGAKVIWVSHCPDQWDLITESELVNQVLADSPHAVDLLFEHLPMLFHCQWMILGCLDDLQQLWGTPHAPELAVDQLAELEPLDELHAVELPEDWAPGWGEVIAAVVPNANGGLAIMGRQGGPAFLEPELHRLQTLISLLP
ncbi:MAG: amino acid-binding protein [Brooklawnia sp.]|jgi:hypothetical protein